MSWARINGNQTYTCMAWSYDVFILNSYDSKTGYNEYIGELYKHLGIFKNTTKVAQTVPLARLECFQKFPSRSTTQQCTRRKFYLVWYCAVSNGFGLIEFAVVVNHTHFRWYWDFWSLEIASDKIRLGTLFLRTNRQLHTIRLFCKKFCSGSLWNHF